MSDARAPEYLGDAYDAADYERIVDILETELFQEVADDPNHRLVVIDHQNGHGRV